MAALPFSLVTVFWRCKGAGMRGVGRAGSETFTVDPGADPSEVVDASVV